MAQKMEVRKITGKLLTFLGGMFYTHIGANIGFCVVVVHGAE